MRLLVVKPSSFGDILHAMPALTDAVRALPGLTADWVVEEAFAELPRWHPAVQETVVVATRRWRRDWGSAIGELPSFLRQLRARRYDLVLDAQGLLRSAVMAGLAKGPGAGFDFPSARERWGVPLYRRRMAVPWDLHAVERQRRLFAAALGYAMPSSSADYGLHLLAAPAVTRPYVAFCIDASWPSKLWPIEHWRALAERVVGAGFQIRLPLANEAQRRRADAVAGARADIALHPTPRLSDLAALLAGAAAVVASDSGPAHLAAALERPQIVLYGPTSAAQHGTIGRHQIHLEAAFPCAPCYGRLCRYRGPRAVEPACFGTLPPELVWERLGAVLAGRSAHHAEG
jgi:heptosyltransferase-1